jgi:hypothetical protein
MTKLIYIASCAHSGSTLLEMLLSAHSSVCGLGEVQMLINDRSRQRYVANAARRTCSCGKSIDKCEIWSEFLRWVAAEPTGNLGIRYKYLLELIKSHYGPEVIITDSSKSVTFLNELNTAIDAGELDLDLSVLHIVKDARSYIASMQRRLRLADWRLGRYYLGWMKTNRKIESYLVERHIRHLRVGYEELCFSTQPTMSRVCTGIDLAFEPQMTSPGYATGHIGIGNPMRNDPIKSQQIIYDYRWFHSTPVLFWYMVLPGIKRHNHHWVYTNSLSPTS